MTRKYDFDARKLPLITRKLEDGLYHNDSATGTARFTPPSTILPTIDVHLDDPIWINDTVGWVSDFTLTKPLYGSLRQVSKIVADLFNGRESQAKRTAVLLSVSGKPVGYETAEQLTIDPNTVAKTLSQRALRQLDEAQEKLAEKDLLLEHLPEGAKFWKVVQVGKPMAYHADVLENGEGLHEDRMARYLADLVKFDEHGQFSTSPAMIDALTMRDFQTLVKAISDASEMAFPFGNDLN